MKQHRALISLMLLVILSSACQPLLEAPLEAQIPGLVHTLAVQTMAADQELRSLLEVPTQTPTQVSPSSTPTERPGTVTPTALPTFTPLPSLTPETGSEINDRSILPAPTMDPSSGNQTLIPVVQATAEPLTPEPVWIKGAKETQSPNSALEKGIINAEGKYCNQVQFVQDVTIPDGTEVQPGEEFTKIWQVKNIGTCTWTPDYSLIAVWGDEMGTRPPVPLGQVVQPGEIAEISMDMKAPYLPACYFTYWMMVDNQGNKFGTGSIAQGNFWVNVSVTVPFLEKYIRFG